MVGFGSRIEFGRNDTHQIDRNFDPNAMEGFPGQFQKASDQFCRILGWEGGAAVLCCAVLCCASAVLCFAVARWWKCYLTITTTIIIAGIRRTIMGS